MAGPPAGWRAKACPTFFHGVSRAERPSLPTNSYTYSPSTSHILLCQAPDQAQRRARIVFAPIEFMLRIVWKVLACRVGIAAHGVERQRQYGLRECRIR